MKLFKKLTVLLLSISLALSVTACTTNTPPPVEPTPTVYGVEVNDVSMSIGTSHTIVYKVTPVGTQALMSYAITSITPADCIRISNGVISSDAVGTATVTATAKSTPNASEAFEVTDTFTVTVTAPQLEGENLVLNGGFENSFYGWTLTPANEENTYKNEVTDNTPHGGVSALNLWSKVGASGVAGEESDVLDLKLTQDIEVEDAGTYLFSLWFKGNIDSITLSVFDAEEAQAAFESFDGFGYESLVAAGNEDYVQYGLEAEIAEAGTYTIELHFEAAWTNNWGFADDVAFEVGTLEDLARPTDPESGQFNFVQNGNITSLDHWTNADGKTWVTKPGSGNYLNCWGTDFDVFQTVENLPNRTYSAVVKVIGPGDSSWKEPTESYFYIADTDGTIIEKVDFDLPGYTWTRVELSDVELSGSVRIGVRIAFAADAWAAFTGFSLWSEGYEHTASNAATLDNIKIDGIDVTDNEGALSVELPFLRYNALAAASADAKSFVSGDLASRATVTSALFTDNGDGTGTLAITVTAENGTTTRNYSVAVTQEVIASEPVEVGLSWDNWDKDAGNPASGLSIDGSKINVYFEEGEWSIFNISQKITGLEANCMYKIAFSYGVKHTSIEVSVNGEDYDTVAEEWASEWTWESGSVNIMAIDGSAITADSNGELTIFLKISADAWSNAQVTSIVLFPIPEVPVGLSWDNWDKDAGNPAEGLSIDGSKINIYFEEGEWSIFNISQNITGLEANCKYKIVFNYGVKHTSIEVSINGEDYDTVAEEWASPTWGWESGSADITNIDESAITADSNGELTIFLKISADPWSNAQVTSITLIPIV